MFLVSALEFFIVHARVTHHYLFFPHWRQEKWKRVVVGSVGTRYVGTEHYYVRPRFSTDEKEDTDTGADKTEHFQDSAFRTCFHGSTL